MAEPSPPIEPYDHGMLDVGDNNLVYGRPAAIPMASRRSSSTADPGKAWKGAPAGRSIGIATRVVSSTSAAAGGAYARERSGRGHESEQTEHLLADMERLREHLGIERWLLHGRLDMSSPLVTAWELARASPDAQPHVIVDSGHTGSETMRNTILDALERFARG
jgi:proline iminopeptidase